MHIDHGIEEPSRISVATTSGTRSKKTTCLELAAVTRGAYQITAKDDSGGLEVILDVYFPLHVASL
ncbi:hypothetical protein U9M48_004236 [Paspalum notatum var. saurae]|uniref:Uncharacterized protein n=1 Tax=Paspalum notatum var. saurae TaxID=547442 RepID=A0AAQ3SL75_PASNO